MVIGHEAGGSYARIPEIAAALQGAAPTVLRRNGSYSQRYAFEWLSRASSLRIHHVRPIIVNGRVVGAVLLSRSPRALFRGLYEDRGKIVLGIVLILGVLIALSGLLSRGIARPIATLGKATRSLAIGEAAIPDTPITAAVEVRELFENFRTMAIAIDHRSRYLCDFAASVSHEFKTPLAGIRGAVELLKDHGDTMAVDERRRFLSNIAQDAERLSQLVTRLLDLARADLTRAEQGAAIDAVATARAVTDAFEGTRCRVSIDAPQALPPDGGARSHACRSPHHAYRQCLSGGSRPGRNCDDYGGRQNSRHHRRQRMRDRSARSGAHFRQLLHDQTRERRHRARSCHRPVVARRMRSDDRAE